MAMSGKTKIITIISSIVVIALAVFIFFRFFFVYSTGVNAGDLNYFQEEGLISAPAARPPKGCTATSSSSRSPTRPWPTS